MTDRIDGALDALLAREGGYVNHPNDPGGATNFGITEGVARANGYRGPMRALTEAQARAIYRAEYFERPGYAAIHAFSPLLAEELLDTAVNCGVRRAGVWLQTALNAFNRRGRDYPNIPVDGSIGALTRKAIASFERVRPRHYERLLIRALDAQQGCHYLDLSNNDAGFEDFTPGWFMHRIGNVNAG